MSLPKKVLEHLKFLNLANCNTSRMTEVSNDATKNQPAVRPNCTTIQSHSSNPHLTRITFLHIAMGEQTPTGGGLERQGACMQAALGGEHHSLAILKQPTNFQFLPHFHIHC